MISKSLNYNHLHYFWVVANSDSLLSASAVLHVTPQTISGQLRKLEERIGERLFTRSGRGLALTETGRVVQAYADQIFRKGEELQEVLRDGEIRRPISCNAGIAMVVPKLIAYRTLEPVLKMEQPVRLYCHEAPIDSLLADLALHKLDLVLTDSPVNNSYPVKAYNHHLGESGLSFFAARKSVAQFKRQFPHSLHRAEFLLPARTCALRDSLAQWFESNSIQPRTVAEFEDSALMNAFGEANTGVYALPTAMENDILQRYKVGVVGRTTEITQSFYLISTERRLRHAAVVAIKKAAASNLAWLSKS